MSSRRNRAARNSVEEEPPMTISPAAVQEIIAGLQHSQSLAYERILNRVLNAESNRLCHFKPPPPTPTPAGTDLRNFANCKSRYSGESTESLEGFLDAVETYKDCVNISDANALGGFSMLLTHEAATWWKGVKSQVTTWPEALDNLRSVFGDRRPPPRIYKELFQSSQSTNEKTDLFVAKARSLLAKLPTGDLKEKVELDMVYSLLNENIRKWIRREEVNTFAELLTRARQVEDSAAPEPLPAAAARFRAPPDSAVNTYAMKAPPSASDAKLGRSSTTDGDTPKPQDTKNSALVAE